MTDGLGGFSSLSNVNGTRLHTDFLVDAIVAFRGLGHAIQLQYATKVLF